jgi:hypothetical protein
MGHLILLRPRARLVLAFALRRQPAGRVLSGCPNGDILRQHARNACEADVEIEPY